MARTVADLARRWFPHRQQHLSETENRVLQSAIDQTPVSRDVGQTYDKGLSVGDRLADSIARVGGSWGFIIAFLGFLVLWSAVNTLVLATHAFDPYPFIFLNLLLSMLAAIQAPVIMMSQNRQAARDRLDAEHDYEVNLKAEIEIMALHEKLDELRHREIIAMREQISDIATQLARLGDTLEAKNQGT